MPQVTKSGGDNYDKWWKIGLAVRERSAVAAETLRSELLAVPGVASAEVDVTEADAPAGIKVRLAPEADARRVGVEVQRVLAAHGMRSRFPPADGVVAEKLAAAEEFPQAGADSGSVAPTRFTPIPVAPPLEASETLRPEKSVAVESVSVEERADELTVTVTLTNGRSASREAGFDPAALDTAVVAAVTEAAGVMATVLAVEWLEVEGATVATVVVRRGAAPTAGAAVVKAGRAFAVANAAIAALR